MKSICISLVLFPWMLLPAFGAGEAPIPRDPPAVPTEVEVDLFVVDLVRVDGALQAFNADVLATFRWRDPRLVEAGAGTRHYPLDKIWHPNLTVVNLRDASKKLPELVEVDEEGNALYRQRLIGDFSCPLDLHEFPFDRQTLFVQVVAGGHTPGQVVFKLNEAESGPADRLSITDWSLESWKLDQKPYKAPRWDRVVPGVVVEIRVERLARYYAWTIFATVMIIVTMAWLVFWIPPSNINPRISISVTSMLSLIAYRFVASQDLPRLPYLTTMDYFLLGATLMVLLGLTSVVLISRRQSHGKEESALRWNGILRWSYPMVFGLMVLVMMLG